MVLPFQLNRRREKEGRERDRRECFRRVQQLLLPDAAGRRAGLRPAVRAALPATVGLSAATGALPTPPARALAAVSQLLLAGPPSQRRASDHAEQLVMGVDTLDRFVMRFQLAPINISEIVMSYYLGENYLVLT